MSSKLQVSYGVLIKYAIDKIHLIKVFDINFDKSPTFSNHDNKRSGSRSTKIYLIIEELTCFERFETDTQLKIV